MKSELIKIPPYWYVSPPTLQSCGLQSTTLSPEVIGKSQNCLPCCIDSMDFVYVSSWMPEIPCLMLAVPWHVSTLTLLIKAAVWPLHGIVKIYYIYCLLKRIILYNFIYTGAYNVCNGVMDCGPLVFIPQFAGSNWFLFEAIWTLASF